MARALLLRLHVAISVMYGDIKDTDVESCIQMYLCHHASGPQRSAAANQRQHGSAELRQYAPPGIPGRLNTAKEIGHVSRPYQ